MLCKPSRGLACYEAEMHCGIPVISCAAGLWASSGLLYRRGALANTYSACQSHLFYAVLGVKEVDQSFAHPFCSVWNNTVKQPLLLCNHSIKSIVHLKILKSFHHLPTACHLKPTWVYFPSGTQKHSVPCVVLPNKVNDTLWHTQGDEALILLIIYV